MLFFFFSSRRRHTRCLSDWSSDVCSSDLEKYRFDHLMLAAQGYQESRLDQQARSRSGAIGIMQIMPSTGKQLGVGDITKAEPNIHGGTKYKIGRASCRERV